jgi:hypothetical protein
MSAGKPKSLVWELDSLFGAPLYAEYDITVPVANYMFVTPLRVDGHCPYCKKSATFHSKGERTVTRTGDVKSLINVETLKYCESYLFAIECTRDNSHRIVFFFRFDQQKIQKIGQYPSLATIANDEMRSYRQVLASDDASDLHRAIGLAAHGVGVGSFVYLRRVFERLINSRFTQFKDSEGWGDDDFFPKRMDEKIGLLKDHLPDFLVENKKLYGILSKGVHELSEEDCLDAFEFLKRSTLFILDDDRRKKEELDSRRKTQEAIADYSRGKAPQSKPNKTRGAKVGRSPP